MTPCERCGNTDTRELRVSLVNLEREARHDGREYDGPPYSHEVRCKDKAACERRYLASREGTR